MWLCDAYILVSGTITVAELAAGRENNSIEAVFKNCSSFTDCISKIKNRLIIDNAKDIDLVMPVCNLMEYIAIIIQKHRTFYCNTIEMNQL